MNALLLLHGVIVFRQHQFLQVAFGVDPSSKHKARQEGAVVINMPSGNTMQTFYSGDDSAEDTHWIKKPGDRTHKNLPDHKVGQRVFFLQTGKKIRRCVAMTVEY